MKKTIIKVLISILASLALAYAIHLKCDKDVNDPIEISFKAKVQKPVVFVLYYIDDKANGFYSEEKKILSQEILPSTNPQEVKFMLEASQIYDFRLDFGDFPGQINLSNIYVQSKEPLTIGVDQMTNRYQIDDLVKTPDGMLLTSNQPDPYIYHLGGDASNASNETMLASTHQEWTLFYVSSFVLFILMFVVLRYVQRIGEKAGWPDALLVVAFFPLLLFPLFDIDDEEKSKTENRNLAVKPTINSIDDLSSYGKSFETWLCDHFYGRESYLAIGHQVNKALNLGFSSGRKFKGCFYGDNDMIYYAFPHAIKYSANTVIFSDEELAYMNWELQSFQNMCDSMGTKFYFIIAPDKDKVYDEYYKYVNKINPDSMSMGYQLSRYLKKNSTVKCEYLVDRLREAKKSKDMGWLYFKHDTHWSHEGAYVGYCALYDMMQKDFNESFYIPKSSFEPYIVLNGATMPFDMDNFIHNEKKDTTDYKIQIIKDNVNDEVHINSGGGDDHHYYSNNPYKMILIGDSYSAFLNINLSPMVGDLYTKMIIPDDHYLTPENIDFIRQVHPDIVVLEILERKLYSTFFWPINFNKY